MPMHRIVVRRVHVTETVEIQWVRDDGSVFYERHTCPPLEVQVARRSLDVVATDGGKVTTETVSWGDTREKAD